MVNEKGIEPHVPVWDKSERTDGSFSRSDFIWDADADEYRCPEGNALRSRQRNFKELRTTVTKAGTVIYRSKSSDCGNCPMKGKCCPNTSFRKIARQLNEEARDLARQLAETERYARSRRLRKKVEMLFAHLKRIMKLDRLRLRGLQGARDDFLLAAKTQNLRRMAMWLMPKDQKGVMARPV